MMSWMSWNCWVLELLAKSQRDGKQARLRTLKDLDTAALQRSLACRVLLESEVAPDQVREAVFERIDAEALAAAIKQVETFARPPEDQYYPEVLEQWRQVRIFLPLLREIEGKAKPKMHKAPANVITKGWHPWVVQADGTVERRAYTFCVLQQLMAGLSRRELFVSPSARWSNPRAKLLQGEVWESLRPQVCRTLNLHPTAAPELAPAILILNK